MRDRLNFFEPWQRLPANHENQLTRAFLVVLRCCPMAHQVWLSLVEPKLLLQSLTRPEFDTQRARILRAEAQPATNESIRGISVLCAADIRNDADSVILESDRGQVLDGIIRYGDDIVIVMESKLGVGDDDNQARNINMHGQPVKFEGQVRRVSWREILANFTDLAEEARGLISNAERVVLADFLDFVAANFSQLGPYNTLARCQSEPSRIARRLRTIRSEIFRSDDATLPGTHAGVTTAYLEYDEVNRRIELRMYPGDTLQQARVLYVRANIVEQILALQDEEWEVAPCFHFGFMAKGFDWTTTASPLVDYLRYWQRNIERTTQIERSDWDDYWEMLLKEKFAEPEDRNDFDRDFTQSNRQTAAPRPGLQCKFIWSLEDAERLDQRYQFASATKDRINQLLQAIGEDAIE